MINKISKFEFFLVLLIVFETFYLYFNPSNNAIKFIGLLAGVTTSLGIIFAVYEFSIKIKRQDNIDKSSVSIQLKNGQDGKEGIFVVKNYGEIPHEIKIEKAILSDGTETPIEYENSNSVTEEFFNGYIYPGQQLDFHIFNITAEEVFVFKGLIRLLIDNDVVIESKVKYAGRGAEMIAEDFPMVHPLYRWAIYYQKKL